MKSVFNVSIFQPVSSDKSDPEIWGEIKDEMRADFEDELLSEQKHLLTEIKKHKREVVALQSQKNTLQSEVKQAQNRVKAEQDKLGIEKSKVLAEQKIFKDMQQKFQPRKDDLEKINKISQEAKPIMLSNKISVTKEDWDFIINIAKQHAKISDTTFATLEKHNNVTNMLKRCQSLYLALATEVAALGYSDVSKLTYRVQDVLRDV